MLQQKVRIKKKSRLAYIWLKYKKNKLAMFGLIILLLLIFIAIFANVIVDYEDDAISQNMENRLQTPNSQNIFGTDQFGRDIFARIIFGARISLFVGLVTILVALALGSVLGATAGYYGGTIDNVITVSYTHLRRRRCS